LVLPDKNQPPAAQILDKYIQALGGAQKLSTLTSWIGTGQSLGYGELGGTAAFTIYAKSPNKHTTRITYPNTERPSSAWAFDGTKGWIKTPRALLQQYELSGQELDGQRFEAQLASPGNIKTALTNWRTGSMRPIGDNSYLVVQGNGPRNFMATLYFDPKTNLLFRMVRYGNSPIGH